MKRASYKILSALIKKTFTGLLTGLVNKSNHKNSVSLSNQKCLIQPTLINLHPNEYSQEFHHYPFVVKLDQYVGSCNTFNDLSNKVCVPNKTRFKSQCVQHDYRNKWINKTNKACVMQM